MKWKLLSGLGFRVWGYIGMMEVKWKLLYDNLQISLRSRMFQASGPLGVEALFGWFRA